MSDSGLPATPVEDAHAAALERIAENAEAWHGPEVTGHSRACAVIAQWAREALAASARPAPAEPPREKMLRGVIVEKVDHRGKPLTSPAPAEPPREPTISDLPRARRTTPRGGRMRQPPSLEARDNLLIMGLLEELGEIGTPMTDERRAKFVEAFDRALKLLYPTSPAPAEPPERTETP